MLLLGLLVFVSACKPTVLLHQTDIASFYRVSAQNRAPSYYFYFKNDTIIEVSYIIPHEIIHYKYIDETKKFVSAYSLKSEVLKVYSSHQSFDSTNFVFYDTLKNNNFEDICSSFVIKKPESGVFFIRMSFENRNDEKKYSNTYTLNANGNSRYNFILKDSINQVLYRDFLFKTEAFQISVNDSSCNEVFVRYYNREFPLARPPYASYERELFKFAPDSIFTIQLYNGIAHNVHFNQQGIYHLQKDSGQYLGKTLFVRYSGFPYIYSSELMLNPLQYITTDKEFDRIQQSNHQKQKVDSFWVNIGGNLIRAKRLIRDYYHAVEEANLLFSSHIEGWKTDRGMIYIIFGMPNWVYRAENYERWIYGQHNHPRSLEFYFTKVDNPFTENDYVLNRSSTYKDIWYITVEKFRK